MYDIKKYHSLRHSELLFVVKTIFIHKNPQNNLGCDLFPIIILGKNDASEFQIINYECTRIHKVLILHFI